ncbi:uncharacterized protein LOC108912978 [Anoplophora glabripennis]|uniref:uncharacterized protein LOC108912978 n=1 Tax=Anoplophora glabripennis TaxID=217634 RepID=UPI0008757650|nr:uncharacterized protein LOC108912978 [Anoplophora glabripennis]
MKFVVIIGFCFVLKFGYGTEWQEFDTAELKERETFFETYLANEHEGKNSYTDKPEFRTRNLSVPPEILERFRKVHTVYGYWLPNTTCYGVTLPSNETVVLECTNDRPMHLQHGCFVVNNPQMDSNQERIVCMEFWRKSCAGIVTPLNWFVEFSCYSKNYDTHKTAAYDFEQVKPEMGNCYAIYDQHEKITPFICQRPASLEKHSCLHSIAEKNSCGLKTPTNETILLCKNSSTAFSFYRISFDPNICLNILRPDESYKEVCLQKFDNYSIGITTPDNFTVLFDSHFCSTFMTNEEREKYKTFTHSFRFDPEIKKCYKVFNQHQKISPYTCLNEDVFNSCVGKLPYAKNCEGIITQNNETVLLHCVDERETSLQNNSCFKIYTANNSLHVACLKRVEERCVGITTPSNLTVLLDCYFCNKPGALHHSVTYLRRSWEFITKYFSNELLGRNSYLGKLHFKAFQESNENIFPNYTKVYGFWLPNSNCYGVTLDSNETVILGCTSKDRISHVRSGCFPVINPKVEQEQVVCSKILDAECIGITSPLNWTVALACYSEYEYRHFEEALEISYENRPADEFTVNFILDDCYEIYYSQEIDAYSCRKRANPKNYACVHWLPGERRCLGLKTPINETIELTCEDTDEKTYFFGKTYSSTKNCFHLYNSTNQTRVCLRKFGNFSVGVTTSSNYSILFNSHFCRASKSSALIKKYKEFIDNFTFDSRIRSCYKIYTPNQDVSPYTCLSKEIFETCIHLLEDSSCMGITTQNNETIVLEYLNGTKAVNETGCFKIYTPDNKVHIACQRQVEEQCIGITTPSNLTVLLECHMCMSTKGGSSLSTYFDEYRKGYRPTIEYFLRSFFQNNYALDDTDTLKVYTPEQDIRVIDCFSVISDYDIHELNGHDKCRGITLKTLETIVFGCRDKKPGKAGCFDIFSPIFSEDNKIIGPEVKVESACVKILNEWCVGITTPKNWTIPLSCYTYVNIPCGIFHIPHNGPPNVEIL